MQNGRLEKGEAVAKSKTDLFGTVLLTDTEVEDAKIDRSLPFVTSPSSPNKLASSAPLGADSQAPTTATRPSPRAPARSRDSNEAVQLIWFDPAALHRIRVHGEWSAIADEIEESPVDAATEELAESRSERSVDDFRLVFGVLSEAEALPGGRARVELHDAIRANGKLIPPIALLEGTLTPRFGAKERLEHTRALAVALSDDERLHVCARSAEALVTSGAAEAPGVARRLTEQLVNAYRASKNDADGRSLATTVDDLLLVRRAYARVPVFGEPKIGCTLESHNIALVVYLPESLAAALPLAKSFAVRLIAEIHPRQDHHEDSPVALRGVALATVVHVRELAQ